MTRAANRPVVARLSFALVWSPCVFDGRFGAAQIEPGPTIADLVSGIIRGERDRPGPPPRVFEHGVVTINDHIVPRELWHVVRPHGNAVSPVIVGIHLAPAGGGDGGGAKVFTALASIALMFATADVSGGAIPGLAAGSFGAELAAAGVGLIGALAIQALAPPPVTPPGPARKESRLGLIAGNTARPGDAFDPAADRRAPASACRR